MWPLVRLWAGAAAFVDPTQHKTIIHLLINTTCQSHLCVTSLLLTSSRFIRLSVRLIHLDCVAAHPGNFEVVLSSSSRVFSLISLIQDHVEIQTSRLEVFRSRVPTEEARLPLEKSLEECGFKGGPEESPPEATVYYDYLLLFTDCPILNCDHYYRSKPDSAASKAGLCLWVFLARYAWSVHWQNQEN